MKVQGKKEGEGGGDNFTSGWDYYYSLSHWDESKLWEHTPSSSVWISGGPAPDGWLCLQMRVTMLSRGAVHTFPTNMVLAGLPHTHTHVQWRGRLMIRVPWIPDQAIIPTASRLIESLPTDAIAMGRNKVWPAGIICAYCQLGVNLWGRATCEEQKAQDFV